MHKAHTWVEGTAHGGGPETTTWIKRTHAMANRALSAAVRFVSGKLALFRTMRHVKATYGKSVLQQLDEMLRLRLGRSRLRVSDYYAFELYDDALYPPAVKRFVVGWDSREVSGVLNDLHWRAVADDKLVCYAFLRGLGLRHPASYALYHEGGRTFGAVPTLTSPEAMADFLRIAMHYPFFAKPIEARHGVGASAVVRLDAERDMLRTVSGNDIAVTDYVDRFVTSAPGGYIFQELLRPHPEIQRVCGDRVSTVRVIVLNGYGDTRLFRIMWRVPVGSNITDNFRHGASGNLMGSVDPATGRVRRVIRGPGPNTRGFYGLGRLGSPVETHPDTGERIEGFALPSWEDTLALCRHAAAALPGLRYQAWDIALCPDGPVIVELNANGGLGQIPGVPGFNDAVFQAFLAEHRRHVRHEE
jgi:hypothetical protein